jgi:hypothetical protein
MPPQPQVRWPGCAPTDAPGVPDVRPPARPCPHPRVRPCRLHRRRCTPPAPTSKPVLITGMAQGGQLMTTTDVDNWPADAMGVQGPELMSASRSTPSASRPNRVRPHPHGRPLGAPFRSGRQRHLHLRRPHHRHRRLGQVPGTAPRNRPSWAAASPPAPPATASSTATGRLRWSAAATRRSRRRCTCPTSPKVHLVHRRERFRAEAIMIDKIMSKAANGNVRMTCGTRRSTRCSETRPASRVPACAAPAASTKDIA